MMRKRKSTRFECLRKLLQLSALAACLGGFKADAEAVAQHYFDFNIRSEELGVALQEFASESKAQIAYDEKVVSGLKANPLYGHYDALSGLNQLLLGTGLRNEKLPSGVFKITAIPFVSAELAERNFEPSGSEDDTLIQSVIVTGQRASLQSAVQFKRSSRVVVDSIFAEDIGKLPDNNIAEALQRVPGVQISRNFGEGASLAVRGLAQVETTINGNETYSDINRGLVLEYVPSDLFRSARIYKNPSAMEIDGGIGGLLDLSTYKPFDFKGFTATMTSSDSYYTSLDTNRPQIDGLLSSRFNTQMGEFGVLISGAYVKTSGRFDRTGVEPFNDRYNLVDFNGNGVFPGTAPPALGSDPGDLVYAPSGGGDSIDFNDRTRLAIDFVTQWRVNSALELSVDLSRYVYQFNRGEYVAYANRGSLLPSPTANFSFSNISNTLEAGAYRDVVFTANTVYDDLSAFTNQLVISGRWEVSNRIKLTGDFVYTRSGRSNNAGGLRIGNSWNPAGTTLNFDVSKRLPSILVTGFDFGNRSSYNPVDSSHTIEKRNGESAAARVDGTVRWDSFIESVEFGTRFSDRNIVRLQGARIHPMPVNDGTFHLSEALPDALWLNPYVDFWNRPSEPQFITGGVLVPSLALVKNIGKVCVGFNDLICYPTYDPFNTYRANERTTAIYGQANFNFLAIGFPVLASLGLRNVSSELSIAGFKRSSTSAAQLVNQFSKYNDMLPSINASVKLRTGLVLRIAAGKQLARPSFEDLSPTETYGLTNANQTLQITTGNPNLKPSLSTSIDTSLELYFHGNDYAYFTLFEKQIKGFTQKIITVEAVSLPDYPDYSSAQVIQPVNGGNGSINGFELGVQSFLTFLPHPFDGLGVQANFTRVNSRAPGLIVGTTVSLPGLSKDSYTLIGYYEKSNFRARVSYSWRDDWLDTISGPGSGSLPIYAAPFGIVDASLGLKLNDHFDVSVDVSNANQAISATYMGFKDRPRFHDLFDRKISLVMKFTY